MSLSIAGVPGSFTAKSAVQLAATASLSDGTTRDVTGSAVWQSSNTAVATVTSSGMLSGIVVGSADVQATYQGVSGVVHISVVSPPLTIATLAWHDEVPGCGGICFQADDQIFVYCGASESDGAAVTVTLTMVWDTGQTHSTTSVFTNAESGLATHNVNHSMWSVPITGAATLLDLIVPALPDGLHSSGGTATCSAVNGQGTAASSSIRLPH